MRWQVQLGVQIGTEEVQLAVHSPIVCYSGYFVVCTPLAYNLPMRYEFIESSLFASMVYDYLSEDDYRAFQQYLMEHPDAGDVVRGSGGVRKVRWARPGSGKSGGVRVCYYIRNQAGQVLLLVIYAKSVRTSISGVVLKQLKELLDDDQ